VKTAQQQQHGLIALPADHGVDTGLLPED